VQASIAAVRRSRCCVSIVRVFDETAGAIPCGPPEVHAAKLGRVPRLVAADAGFYSAKNEAAAKAKGVKRVCIPNRGSKNAARKREHKKRWFRDGQRWRTGCEGRISVSKRRHGLQRCRYRGDDGMRRWVGLGVIADNLINIGRAIAAHPAT
jgi:transposase, IS5 family